MRAETAAELTRRTATAFGREAPDLVLRGGRVLLPTGELLARDIAVSGTRIAAVAKELTVPGARTVDVSRQVVVPGYVEPHAHGNGGFGVDAYVAHGITRGVTTIVSDDSYAYTLLDREQYGRMLDYSAVAPVVFEWSMRTDAGGRTIGWADLLDFIERPDVRQVGEIITAQQLDPLDGDLAALFARTRSTGRRMEGHSPGASSRTLGAAATAGISADHEAIRAGEVVERLRLGIWAILRHNGLRPDVPALVGGLLEAGAPLTRTAFTIDGAMPGWIARNGMIDAAIAAAMAAGLPAADAYAMGTLQPAAYLRLDDQVGAVAPGRLATFNVLDDLDHPAPRSVFHRGVEVARDGALEIDAPRMPWAELGAPRWSPHDHGPPLEAYAVRDDDPAIHLESQAIVRPGAGPGAPLSCVAIDPVTDRYTRARFHGFPAGVRAVATTLSPERLLVTIGSDPEAMRALVDAIHAAGGGIGYVCAEKGLRLLPLPVGGVVTGEPFAAVADFWLEFEAHLHELGHTLPEPAMTLLFIPTDALPGARFVADGLIATRGREVLRASEPVPR